MFQVLSAVNSADLDQWLRIWNQWTDREIYGHPHYLKLYTDQQTSHALCAVLQSPDGCICYPFILRDLTMEPFWTADIGRTADIITPYGYGGPFYWGDGDIEAIAHQFWQQFDRWAEEHHIVSEFIRFALMRYPLPGYSGLQEQRQDNVVCDLSLSKDALWMSFKHKVRKNVSKAKRNGVWIEQDAMGKRLGEFLTLYQDTMIRRQAQEGYFFPRSFFEQIAQTLPGQFMYFHALYQGKVISTELVLLSANRVYSFLGGTDSDYFDYRPNDLLKYEIMLWAKQAGKRWFILGGGYASGDGIYQYKLAFAPEGAVPFYIGKRVLSQERYSRLIQARQEMAIAKGQVWAPVNLFFPEYRA